MIFIILIVNLQNLRPYAPSGAERSNDDDEEDDDDEFTEISGLVLVLIHLIIVFLNRTVGTTVERLFTTTVSQWKFCRTIIRK